MTRVDARTLSKEALEQRREEVVRLNTEGISVREIVARTGLSQGVVYKAIKLSKAGGQLGLKTTPRGRKSGSGSSLTIEQEAAIRQLLRRRPKAYKYSDLLWTRATVLRLIQEKIGVQLSVRGIDNYLVRWGVLQPSSKKYPYGQCTPEIRRWWDTHQTAVEEKANEIGAEIYWLRKPISLDVGMWSPANTAGAKKPQDRVSLASVSNSKGSVRWAIFQGQMNADRQQKLIGAAVKDSKRKAVILIRSDATIFRSVFPVVDQSSDADSTLHWTARLKSFPKDVG